MINPLEDLRYSLRGLRRSPIFTIVALFSLALGIGANTAVFTLMDQALLRLLPVQHPEQLVLFSATGPRRGSVNTSYDDTLTFSYPMFVDFRDRSPVFDGVLARFPVNFGASWHGETERISGELVSGNYFSVLGVRPAVGRTLSANDDRTIGGQPVVVLSYAYWKRRFGAEPGVLNQTLVLNAHSMTIVGVAQMGFQSIGKGETPDVFVPITMHDQLLAGQEDLPNRRSAWLNIFARLKPGESQQQAEAAMNTFWRPILEMELKELANASQSVRTRFLNRRLSLLPGAKGISSAPESLKPALIALMAMVGVLLLIACANVANLMIARATARQREISIRLAMGASRFRLVRQLLMESLLLSLCGGLLGLLAAEWTNSALTQSLGDDGMTQGLDKHLDARVFLFALALSLLTSLLFGLVPALQGTRTELASTLKDQASGVLGGFGQLRLRKALVITQVALSLLLLIGAGLFAKSLYNVKNINPGFRTDHLISFRVAPQLNGYSQDRIRNLFQQLQEDISHLPGVRAVSASELSLLAGDSESSNITVVGYHAKEDEDMNVFNDHVGPRYFATIGIPLIAGRDITSSDGASAPKVVVVNEELAHRFFGHENPLGRRIALGRDKVEMEIVGVVRDGKTSDLRELKRRFMYMPYSQARMGPITFYARTAQDPSAVTQTLRDAVRRLDPNLPVFNVKTMERQIDESLVMDRLVAALSAAFGSLATLLAAVGLYGVMAYMVVRRTREIGIRMALGAGRKEVLRMVMGEVLLLAGAGIGIAIVASFGTGRMIGSLLLNVSGSDPVVTICATAGLAVVALLAGLIPALRASRVDPLTALRYE